MPTLARRFSLHLIAIALGAVLMLPFYWAAIGSLKRMTEVRQIPLVWWPAILQCCPFEKIRQRSTSDSSSTYWRSRTVSPVGSSICCAGPQ